MFPLSSKLGSRNLVETRVLVGCEAGATNKLSVIRVPPADVIFRIGLLVPGLATVSISKLSSCVFTSKAPAVTR